MPYGIGAVNSMQEVQECTPETFRFHGSFKGIPKMVIEILQLVNTHETEYAPRLVGNAQIIYEEIKRWQKFEQKPRRLFLITIYLIGLFIYFFDSNFREHGNYMLARLFERRKEFRLPPHHLDPETWGPEGGRRIPGLVIDPSVVEELTEKSIVLRGPLTRPRTYVLQIRGNPDFYGIDGPVGLEIGRTGKWIYPVIANYGPDTRNLIFGDTKEDWQRGMEASGEAVRTG